MQLKSLVQCIGTTWPETLQHTLIMLQRIPLGTFITNQASLDRALSDIRFDTWYTQSPGTLQISGNTSNAGIEED